MLPALKRKGLANDATWYIGVFRQAHDYALVGGSPDEYVIESWVDGPSRAVPETADWTFTRSVLDFGRVFLDKMGTKAKVVPKTSAQN